MTLRTRRGGPPPETSTTDWVAKYKRGDSLATIAAATGYNASTIRKYLLREGVTLRGTRDNPRIPEAERKRLQKTAVRAYERGDALRTIADDTGHTYGTVRKALLDAGTVLRPQGAPHPPPEENSDPSVPARPDTPGPVTAP